jgi:hypothetical protein
MNSSHQTPFMDKSVPEWLLKNPTFMEQLKKQKEQRILKEKLEKELEQKEPEASSSKANIVELD